MGGLVVSAPGYGDSPCVTAGATAPVPVSSDVFIGDTAAGDTPVSVNWSC